VPSMSARFSTGPTVADLHALAPAPPSLTQIDIPEYENGHARMSDSVKAPKLDPVPDDSTSGKTATPSKTAALIEMYREKERGGSKSPGPASALQASRLPVRTGSLTKDPIVATTLLPPAKVAPTGSSPLPAQPTATPAPAPALGELVGNTSEDGRYVHGSPLHNVAEEEEEEEEDELF